VHGTSFLQKRSMKAVILEGIKRSKPVGRKSSKKLYQLTGTKQKVAASALKVLGALNALDKVFSNIKGYGRKLVLDSILPEWLKDVVSGKKKIEAFTVTTGDAKALIVPMKKYAPITEQKVDELYTLEKDYGVDLDIEEKRHYEFNDKIVEEISEDKMTELIDELKQALLKSTVVPAALKKEIRAGKIAVIEERIDYEYEEDVLTNLPKLADGDVKTAKAIVDTVKPVFALRSFEMEDRDLQVAEALDLIKENMDAIPEAEEKE
jgi:hypothetical protein